MTKARLIDSGGTFTDLAMVVGRRRSSTKVPPPPQAPEERMMTGIAIILRQAVMPGGGCGDPRQRHVEAVLADVRLGLVSVEAAREDYGVAVGEDGRCDAAETARLRAPPAP